MWEADRRNRLLQWTARQPIRAPAEAGCPGVDPYAGTVTTLADLLRPLGDDGLARLGSVLDELADGIAVFDPDWTVVWVNRAGAELLGRPPDRLIGRNLWTGFPDSGGLEIHREFHRAAAEQRQIELKHFDGRLGGWFEVRAIPTAVGMVALFRDVTARHRHEVLLAGTLQALSQVVMDADLTDVLDTVTSMVERESPHGALASVLLASPDGTRLRHGSAPSLPPDYVRAVDGLAVGTAAGSCGTAAHRKQQVIVEDIEVDPLWADWRNLAIDWGLRACWSTPVLDAAGRVLAIFAVYYRAPRLPEPADQRLIEQATQTVAVAIEHDRRRRALQDALDAARSAAIRSRRLQDLAAELSAALLPEQVARICAEYARESLGAEGAWVVLRQGGAAPTLLASMGLPDDLAEGLTGISLSPGPAGGGPGPVWVNSSSDLSALLPAGPTGRPGSVALLPMQVDGRLVGYLGVYRSGEADFGAEEQGEAVAVGAQTAQALLRASQFASTRHVAESLQRSLLTEPPAVDGLTVAVRYRPATTAAEVGGDWYDAFLLPTGLHVVIGDVMGHDLDAAGRMGQLRSFLRTLAHDRGGDPAALLERLDGLNEDLQVTEFTSLILARISDGPGGRAVEWSNAGHPAALLLGPDGTGQVLPGAVDPPLGIGRGVRRRNSRAALPDRSTLLLYTDGLVELSTRALDRRIEELCRHAARLASAPLDDFCDSVLGFSQATADDVALVAVRGRSPLPI